ncbi:MAG: SMC-Scp complex subunit ScpB, partial [Candidatus Methylomirabilaceae bacterium]
LALIDVAGGYRLVTKPEVSPWIQRLQGAKPARLSKAALETLAIIAYKQPITRPEIEAIRGVIIDGVIKTLVERDLIRILGRKPEVGRPILYGTSRNFLEYFGFRDLSELPTLKEIEALAPRTGDEETSDHAGHEATKAG